MTADDKVTPSHYKGFSNGAIPWDIAERLNYNRGTALVYIARAGRKAGESALDDLKKARRYLDREIDRIIADGKETDEKPRPTIAVEPTFIGTVEYNPAARRIVRKDAEGNIVDVEPEPTR